MNMLFIKHFFKDLLLLYIDHYMVCKYKYNTYYSFKYMLINYYNYTIILYKYIIYYLPLLDIISKTILGINKHYIYIYILL